MLLPARTFFMIRHGQTEANKQEIMAGQMNSPLTALGREQAETARSVVEKLERKPGLIVHSPLDRAKDTALAINRNLGIPMLEDKDIGEIYVGEWEGTSYEHSYKSYLKGIDPPGGETHAAFRERVGACIRRHYETAEETVMFVCHGGVMRAFASLYKVNSYRFKNCHLHEFEPDTDNTVFPWKVWQHDLLETGIVNRILSPLFHNEEAGEHQLSIIST